jgi:elongation factor Ts
MITAELVKKLRDKTGASMMECKDALDKSNGDEIKALEILQEKGKMTAMKKSERTAKEGVIISYIHSNNKMGVLLELKCETDFVAKNQEFRDLARELAMHIAGMDSKDEKSLLSEPYVKDPSKTVKDIIDEKITKLGENIKIGRLSRFEL